MWIILLSVSFVHQDQAKIIKNVYVIRVNPFTHQVLPSPPSICLMRINFIKISRQNFADSFHAASP